MRILLENGSKVDISVEKEGDIYAYYIGRTKIGAYDPKIMADEKIVMRLNTLTNEKSAEIKDKIDNLEVEQIESEAKENEEIDQYIIEHDIKNTKQVTKLNLDRDEKEEEKEKKKDTQLDLKEEKKKEDVKQDNLTIKQEVKLDERANDMENIRQWLGNNVPKEITKIGVIESDEMNKMSDKDGNKYSKPTTRFSLVAIDKNGNVKPLKEYIPELEQRSAAGNNPTEEKYQIGTDGKVEKDAILSEYEIGNKVLQIDSKEMRTRRDKCRRRRKNNNTNTSN